MTEVFPPGPPVRSAQVFGALGYYVRFALDPLGFVRRRFERYGDLYYAPTRRDGLYVSRHPEHLREVLVTRASSYAKTHTAFAQLSRVLGDGLLTTDGDVWKRQRRMVNPGFTQARLLSYAGAMSEEASRTRDALPRGEAIDVGRTMMDLTLRVVSRTLFGHDSRGDTDDVARAMDVFQRESSRPDLLPAWLPSPSRAKLGRAVELLDRVVYGMLEKHRAAGPEQGPPSLLAMLVAAVDEEGDGARLTSKELRDQLVTLFLAGHETTSHVLTWTLYLLGRHPEEQRLLREEIHSVLGARAAPTAEDLPKLTRTRCALEEAMRLYPPVYGIARRAREDTELGGYRVAAGSEVMLWVYHAHHDARWWPEPERFRPERFAQEDPERPRLAFAPFGAGPRACIGKAFAMMEAQLLLATLLARHRFEPAEERPVGVVPRVTLCPSRPVRMRALREPS